MTELVARMLFPFSLVLAASFWLKAYAAVGDGFSAGAAAGLGAIVQYVCLDHETARRRAGASWALRFVSIGLMLTLLVALGPALIGEPPVTHWPRSGEPVAKIGTLDLHTAVLFDLGVALTVYGVMIGTFDRLFPPFEEEEP